MPDPAPEQERPVLGDEAGQAAAENAVGSLIAELQEGWDQRDAEISDRHFAADVAWGSPFGATVHGYQRLHDIHRRLKASGVGGPASRYEIEHVLSLGEDVAVAHVARRALDADGRVLEPTQDVSGGFSEMAMYVLVRRNGTWWLAAGQNTPMRPGGAA